MLNKMGETIALFCLYRDTGEEEWSIRAEELLDDICGTDVPKICHWHTETACAE